MPELKSDAMVTSKNKKVKEQVQSGTTQPLPTAEDTPEQKKAETEAERLAKGIREKLEALKKELAAVKEKEKAAKDAQGAAKKAEKEAALAKREEAKKQIEAADEAVKKAQADLELTDEWKALAAAKTAREAIGPLPKAPRVGGGSQGPRKPRESGAGGLNGSELRAMRAINAAGHALSRKELAEATGQEKGWSKLLGTKEGGGEGLVDRGLLNLVMHEDEPMRYSLTDPGKEALAKAEAEAAAKPEAPAVKDGEGI